MKGKQSIMIGVIALALCCCGKKLGGVEGELQEAGYEMTLDGWFGVIRANNVVVMGKMVKGGFGVQEQGTDGRNGLHIAAEAGRTEAAGYLLDQGLAIDGKDGNGRTPLMQAVIADQSKMVKWLLQQRANPNEKDNEDYNALMLAVTHGSKGVIEELAPYYTADLDTALLYAAMVGNAEAIDALTNFGASVHTRMEDGRTPLMMAAQKGHKDAVAMLLDVGASRLATTDAGESAQSFAVAGGHHEVVELIERGFGETALVLESDEEVEQVIQEYISGLDVDLDDGEQLAANGDDTADVVVDGDEQTIPNPRVFGSIEGARVSVSHEGGDEAGDGEDSPLVMRHYHQRELPVEVKEVKDGTARIRIAGAANREIEVRDGDEIPRSRLVVVKVYTRVETGKLNEGQPIEIGVVEVEDRISGKRREWLAGRPVTSHDAVALVEDGKSGKRYIARPGQRFFSEDGREYVVSDVRPGQMVIEDVTTGETSTLPLRGAKG
jgi:ankyrin repeat protein